MNHFSTSLLLSFLVLTGSLAQASCALLGGGAKTPPVFGSWSFSMDNASQGTMTGTMALRQQEDGSYTGRIAVAEPGIDDVLMVHSLDIEGAVFRLHGTVAGSEFRLNGAVEGDVMTGTNDVVGLGVFSFNATRVPDAE